MWLPGSMGLPIIGESMDFFSLHPFEGILPFIKKGSARYGKLFKITLVGHPVVVSTDPEVNYYVFQQEEALFQCWYTKNAVDLTGKFGFLDNKGTFITYHASLQGRKKAINLSKTLWRRGNHQRENETKKISWITYLVKIGNEESILTEDTALNTIFGVLVAAFETNSSAIALSFKFRNDHPDVLTQLMNGNCNAFSDYVPRKNTKKFLKTERTKSLLFHGQNTNQ
ncbi:3-epi-6-deoxocathasterone 23-monooxygenase CYP90D1-like [Lycium ferocissimum]|uniref:3-epi-6-deoxocathasterone 23-monooxygenase CYP90D1-like n=1 Tax=Lycium ferocissimum TaxID=112874 RepID=UPI0028152804|nr:3-epi-6-deoxocathasterone 23-monooxygenase CYP90D1-like [Lycium ferocissimum]